MDRQRRLFLQDTAQLASLASLAALAASGGVACARAEGRAYPFSLGVASGSPLPHSVILWTRILADPLSNVVPLLSDGVECFLRILFARDCCGDAGRH